MMNQNYVELPWDSAFFGFRVGKIETTVTQEEDLISLDALLKKNHSILTYLTSKNPLPEFAFQHPALEVSLVTIKTTFVKKSILKSSTLHPVVELGIDDFDENSIKLAIQAGIFSRFNKDANIKKKSFERLYTVWIKKALNHQMAKVVLGFKVSGQLAGLITLDEKEKGIGEIGLIAVDKKYRGIGIGKALIESGEQWFHNQDIHTVRVITQAANVPASNLYKAFGYTIFSEVYFYHIWR